MATDMTVAETILSQLGGRRFIVMTGAKNFVGDADSLRFRIPQSKGINFVQIQLMPSDTYNVTFGRVRAMTYTEVAKLTDIYCDQLQEIFTRYTGLVTRI